MRTRDSSDRYNRRTGGVTSGCVLGIGQAHPEVLQRFCAAIGFGDVKGPRRVRTCQMWQVKVCGFEKVQAAIALLWPWLGTVKRAQCVAVIRNAILHRSRQPKRHFDSEELAEIRARLTAGESQASIASAFQKPRQAINRIARGRAYVAD